MTMRSLAELCLQQNDFARRIALLVYDNSPNPQPARLDRWNFGSVQYCHASKNDGLAAAYNRALSMAHDGGIDWLLLLDQDTAIGPALFAALFSVFSSPLGAEICAVVPKLLERGKMLSPQFVGKFHNRDYRAAGTKISGGQVTAFNSAACLRVRSVEAIGGFPEEYWLDFLDHVMFHRLQVAGGRVLILDLVVEHRLSLRHLDTEMSLDRYANLLASEWRFIRETGTGGGAMVHRLRLLKRAISHSVKFRNKAYAFRTLRAALQ